MSSPAMEFYDFSVYNGVGDITAHHLGRYRYDGVTAVVTNVELYDTKADPLEMNNLAASGRQHRELIVAMNDKLNGLIDAEVGEDRGQMLPGGIEAGWDITPETMAP